MVLESSPVLFSLLQAPETFPRIAADRIMHKRRGMLVLPLTILIAVLWVKNVSASYNEDCTNFLASEPQAMDGEFADRDIFRLRTRDGEYQLQHKLELYEFGAIAEDNDTTSLCVGFNMWTSRTVQDPDTSNDSISTVKVETNKFVATAIVNVSSDCWARVREISRCDPVFIMMPEIMASSLYSYSPLREKFWSKLEDKDFKDQWIQKITLENTNKSIPGSWVHNLKLSSLRYLKIMGNDWQRPEKLLSKLPALQKLDLTFNNIQELPPDTFNSTPLLRDIILARNNLSVFPQGLGQLEGLFLLDITNPKGRARLSISQEDVSTLHKVNVFGLENINLSTNITALLGLPKLTFLNLSGCGIDKIDDVSYNTERKLLVLLDLSKNNLSKLPAKLFSSLRNIRTLFLQNNAFDSCPPFIENLPLLNKLDLSYNRISRLTTLCFDRPHNSLEYLDLSNNQISVIMDRVFQSLNALRTLKLSNNRLSTIQSSVFQGLSHLSHLDLSSNQLTSEISFKRIEIKFINLSNNRLVSLPNISDWDTKLNTIDISKNNITQWIAIPSHVSLLNVSYNGITKLSKEMRDSLDSRVEVVDLGGNYFNCCESDLKEVKDWLKITQVDLQNLGTKHVLKCLIPGENQRYPFRTFLDEEGLCGGANGMSRTYKSNDSSVLYGVTSFLTILVLVLSIALAYIVYKQRHNVLTWFKFTDS